MRESVIHEGVIQKESQERFERSWRDLPKDLVLRASKQRGLMLASALQLDVARRSKWQLPFSAAHRL